jgi:hypothetical protein
MIKSNVIEIINEEISDFDFLGNDEFLKEQEVVDLLKNEELQKQFICDSLLNKDDKVKIVKIADSSITGDWNELNTEETNRLRLEYSIDMAYVYDSSKEPLLFNLYFNSDDIDISVDGLQDDGDAWYNGFDWSDVNVSLFTMDGDEIKFTAFENAPEKIQRLFIRQYIQDFIENESLNIKTPEIKDTIKDTSYC